MSSYILPVFVVIPGAPLNEYESELPNQTFRTNDSAVYYASWLVGDQGRGDTGIVETFVECPVINDVIYVPDWINP